MGGKAPRSSASRRPSVNESEAIRGFVNHFLGEAGNVHEGAWSFLCVHQRHTLRELVSNFYTMQNMTRNEVMGIIGSILAAASANRHC